MYKVAILEPSVASECVVTEMMGQIRCASPFLAGACENAGYSCRVFAEELIEFSPALLDRISQEFDAVGISVALNTLPRGLQIARALKRRQSRLPIAMGGPSASAFADKLLDAADVVFHGRSEVTFPRWLKTLDDGTPPENIPGSIVRRSGTLLRNPQPIPIGEAPTRYDLVEGFGPRTVREGMFGFPKPAIYSLFASTGCIRHCRFCKSEKAYHPRPIAAVIADLELLLRLHNHRGQARFMLVDDCLFADLDWTKELLRQIYHACKGHDVSFSTQFHVQPTADEELMRLFKQAHFTSLALGFESISQASLNHERKGTTTVQNDFAIEQCRRFSIVPYGYFIVGFDTDNEAIVRATYDYIVDRKMISQVLPVGIINRYAQGQPTPEAHRILSDISYGATVFVSHRPEQMKASRLQQLINSGYSRISSLRRLSHFQTAYERKFLFGLNRCVAVWKPLMEAHVRHLQDKGE